MIWDCVLAGAAPSSAPLGSSTWDEACIMAGQEILGYYGGTEYYHTLQAARLTEYPLTSVSSIHSHTAV